SRLTVSLVHKLGELVQVLEDVLGARAAARAGEALTDRLPFGQLGGDRTPRGATDQRVTSAHQPQGMLESEIDPPARIGADLVAEPRLAERKAWAGGVLPVLGHLGRVESAAQDLQGVLLA